MAWNRSYNHILVDFSGCIMRRQTVNESLWKRMVFQTALCYQVVEAR